jgi:hypothetical protein
MATVDLSPDLGSPGTEEGPSPLPRRGPFVRPAGTIAAMRPLICGSRAVPALLLVTLLVAACGGSGSGTASGATRSPERPTAAPATAAPATPGRTAEELTPVPGGSTDAPPTEKPVPTRPSTTTTDWGTILDGVPDDFPVYPGAASADVSGRPASGDWLTDAPVDEVATWYRDALESAGFTTQDLSSALEDGSRVLDTVSDLPECRIQTTFRPTGESTMITVLYGAGCAGGEG